MKSLKTALVKSLPFIFVFISSLYQISDPDLGWHLRYGKYFFENHSILRANVFSSHMPNFVWTNISWGIDLLTFLIYSSGGLFALIVAGALLTTISFYFYSKAFKIDLWQQTFVFPIILYFLIPINATSFRGQNLSLMLLGLMMFILSKYKASKDRSLYFLPLLFLLWANLHGLFIFGLGVLFLWEFFFVLSKYLQKKDSVDIISYLKHFLIIDLLTIGATLIHPFGVKIYTDTLAYFNNPLLKDINEYLPPGELTTQWYNLYFAALIAVIGYLLYLVNKKFFRNLAGLGIFAILFLMSLWVKRYSWAMYYFLAVLILPIADIFKPSKKYILRFSSIAFACYIMLAIYIKGPFSQYSQMSWKIYCKEYNNCSDQAALELKNHYIEGKTMTLYNWGGWLIWNYPELKPSTDGRMHLWRNDQGFSAFEYDYKLEQNLMDIDSSSYDVVFTGDYKPIFERLVQLTRQGKWEKVYQDGHSAIFIRKT